MKFHPLADLFPMIEGTDFDALVTDIRQNGLINPITTFDGVILDGRNRYRACEVAGIVAQTQEYTGSDPLSFVISNNLKRRHLNESQRSMVASKLANMPAHRPKDKSANLPTFLPTSPVEFSKTITKLAKDLNNEEQPISQPEAAEKLNVSERLVRDAKAVRSSNSPELIRRVEQGEIAVSTAAKVARLEPEIRSKIETMPEPQLRASIKKVERANRETALAEETKKAFTALATKSYSVIYADPPWRFEPYSRETGMDRAADNHYPTSNVDDICRMKPLSTKDAVLFLWATSPMLPEAFRVLQAWGFEYKSQCIWVKNKIGTGYWFRNTHEILLVGTKGNIPAPAPGEQPNSTISADVNGHSKKPEVFIQMIETMFPNLSKLEMFARQSRNGWDSWGNENK